MTCPECQIAYDPEHWDCCPHCGTEHERSGLVELSGVMRTSTILIAAGHGEPAFYRSVDEVPEPLRRMLVSSTHGLNSGTIYIADRGGREHVTRALRNLPAASDAGVPARFSPALTAQPERPLKAMVSLSALWLALLIAVFLCAIVWLAGSRAW